MPHFPLKCLHLPLKYIKYHVRILQPVLFTISRMLQNFSALLSGRPYHQEISLVLIYFRAEFEPGTIMLSVGHKFWSLCTVNRL